MADVQLNFINRSDDSNANITIFQQNTSPAPDQFYYAWMTLERPTIGSSHSFTFPNAFQIEAENTEQVKTSFTEVNPGQHLIVDQGLSELYLTTTYKETDPEEIHIENNLLSGSINANIYKDGKLLLAQKQLAPKSTAEFKLKPRISITSQTNLKEGDPILPSQLPYPISTISLEGVQSADLVMTGGGPGPNSTPFEFELENVVKV